MKGDVGPWVLGGVMALLGSASPVAPRTTCSTVPASACFVFGVLFIFYLIHRNVGR